MFKFYFINIVKKSQKVLKVYDCVSRSCPYISSSFFSKFSSYSEGLLLQYHLLCDRRAGFVTGRQSVPILLVSLFSADLEREFQKWIRSYSSAIWNFPTDD